MTAAYAVYWLNFAVILLGGLAATRARQMDRALMGLITALFGVAGMYMLMNAPYVALMQIMIYVGAVGVLVFFAVMLTRPSGNDEPRQGLPRRPLLAAAAGLLPALTLGAGVYSFLRQARPAGPEVGVAALGAGLLNSYVLAFELISVVLFAAMAGGVLLGFERRKRR